MLNGLPNVTLHFARSNLVQRLITVFICLRVNRCISTPSRIVHFIVMLSSVILLFAVLSNIDLIVGDEERELHRGLRHLNHIKKFDVPHKERPQIHDKEDNDEEIDDQLKVLQKKIQKESPKDVTQRTLSSSDQKYLDEKLIRSFGRNYKQSPDYKYIVHRCSEDKKKQGRVLNLFTEPFTDTQDHLCKAHIDLLIAVHSRPSNFDRRNLIRNTYGSMRNVNGKRVVVAFFLGNSKNENIQHKISKEIKDFRDIVRKNYDEHYKNMTIKHLSIMEWITEYCSNAHHLVKVDDDVFVNIFQVLTYVETFPPSGFYCSRTIGPRPERRNKKWKVTYEEYPRKTFPPYCMGFAYLLKASKAKEIYWCSVFSKFLWIDDVLVGGLLPEKLGLRIDGFMYGHKHAYIVPSHATERVVDFMFLMGQYNSLMPKIFSRIWRASLQYSY